MTTTTHADYKSLWRWSSKRFTMALLAGPDKILASVGDFLCPWMDGMPRSHGCERAAMSMDGRDEKLLLRFRHFRLPWRAYAVVAWMRKRGDVHGWTGRKAAPAFSALPPSMVVGRKAAPAFSALPPSMVVGRKAAPAFSALPPSLVVVCRDRMDARERRCPGERAEKAYLSGLSDRR